jgi:fatty-acyl-CoA synthase
MKGLMQEFPLTLELIFRRAQEIGRSLEVVSVQPSGVDRRTWGDVCERALRLCTVLDRLGVDRGAPVGTFAWNSHRHLELYFAAPLSGRALHAANVRLHPDQVVYSIGHAGDEVVFVDAALTEAFLPIRERLSLRQVVVMEDGTEAHPAFADCPRYEDLLDGAEPIASLPAVAEDDAASICFTSGTTGNPKAVVYSQRSVVLHTMATLMYDNHAVSRTDVLLPLTPMFHVNCWGLPYSAAFAPAKLVLAGSNTTPDAVARLIEAERATVIAGIPTFWVQMDGVFASGDYDLSSVRAILCGGSEAAPSLISRYLDRGIDFMHAWGMTEMSPTGTATWHRAGSTVPDEANQGAAVPGVELRIATPDGELLPWDGEAVGELQTRGPWIARAYMNPDDDANEARFPGGWLRTGDMARMNPDGSVAVVDRLKDLVKSGGEWISSLDVERALLQHPQVSEVAVIAIPHERWGERPAALVVPVAGAEPEPAELVEFLGDKLARWQLPDVVELVSELPKTGVGKYDKKRIRAEHAERLARKAAEAAPA